jgi:hypothetical protein
MSPSGLKNAAGGSGNHLLNHKRCPLAYGGRAQARNADTVDLDAAYAYPPRGSRHE